MFQIRRSAAGSLAYGPVFHGRQPSLMVIHPRLVGSRCYVQNIQRPLFELGMQPVVNPLTLPSIRKQPASPQLGKMPGDLRLVVIECPDQLTHAQLTLSRKHEHDPSAGFVPQAFEEGVWCKAHKQSI